MTIREAGLAAALRLGLFEALAEPRHSMELADERRLNTERVHLLFLALAADGWLARRAGAFVVRTEPPDAAVDAPGGALLADLLARTEPLEWHEVAGNLDAAVLAPPAPSDTETAAITHALVAVVAPVLANGGRVLDASCDDGRTTGEILARAPLATAVLVAPHTVLALASHQLAAKRARIELMPVDHRAASLPTCRVAFARHRLERREPEAALAFVRALAQPVLPGGLLALVELCLDDMTACAASAWRYLSMRLQGTQPHTCSELQRWLADAGLVGITREPIADTPFSLFVARRRLEILFPD